MIETVPSGTVLQGRYRIERTLGSGGFGHVYLAIDLARNQQCAVKEYLVTGTGGQEQLKHEATVLSQLHHPNLPAFQDAFIANGRYYVVLNYIEGNDLTDLIIRTARQRNEAIPTVQIMSWMLSICDAVLFLHNQHPSVIHRDIKPDNIRITSNGTAVLVDLGNAKAAADGARTLLFIRHQGTPGYAPPEQYPGGSGTDTRSDIYALAATLYFALMAQEPPSVSTRNQFMQQGKPNLPSLQEGLANNPPESNAAVNEVRQFRLGVSKPSKPAPRHLHHLAQLGFLPPALLNQLNQIIQRGMAMRPKDRYQFIIDFAEDLRKVMVALSIPPTPTPPRSSHLIDPHSTQPDLPQLYEAIQAAQEKPNDPNQKAVSTNAPIVPSRPTAASCPRCNAPLTAQTQFCPRCGTPLASSAPHLRGIAHDISAEQTVIVTPSQIVQAVPRTTQRASSTTKSNPSTTSSTSSASSNSFSSNHPAPMATQVPPTPFPPQGPSVMNTPPIIGTGGNSSGNSSSPPSSSNQSNLKIALMSLVVVIVLLVIIAFFIINQNRQNHIDLHISLHHWHALQTQGFFYERIFSSTAQTAPAGIW